MIICKIHAFNHRAIESNINCLFFFIFLLRLIESSPPYLKKTGELHAVDQHTPVKLPQSNEATGRVTKGQTAKPASAGLANKVLLL